MKYTKHILVLVLLLSISCLVACDNTKQSHVVTDKTIEEILTNSPSKDSVLSSSAKRALSVYYKNRPTLTSYFYGSVVENTDSGYLTVYDENDEVLQIWYYTIKDGKVSFIEAQYAQTPEGDEQDVTTEENS